ncbi:sigma-70 family RNA polymerase sigma factor [Litchfieldia alkalitelluris]|uniref:sigma-70 family RNA polymerase sigma factor n=1 Tax=Litchfieldia alkalitelluris TaxID=304268 RepID=UPI00147569F5|nr:sigma-70 family RNA polymerase sigma factor [Litchfieldia alkalitelluris]
MNEPLHKKIDEEKKRELVEGLIDQYGKALINFAYTYVKDWSLAEDIVQEVFISVYKADQYVNITAYKAWLFTITANKSKDLLRRKYFKTDLFVGIRNYFWKAITHTPEMEVMADAENRLVSTQVFDLPIKYREVIILYYYEDLSTSEISDLLRLNPSTVKSRLQRGRHLLKRNLEGSDWFEA